MVNEKFRERVSAWDSFKNENTDEFAGFFENILRLCLNKPVVSAPDIQPNLSYKEQTILIKFLDNCVNSLEMDLVRVQVQKICGLPMWISLSENRREHEFKKLPKLRKFWKAIEKSDAKLDDAGRQRAQFERTFLKALVQNFIGTLHSFDERESGELVEKSERTQKLRYLERFLELLIDLEALLPTRRFFNTLLEDCNLLIYCYLSDLVKKSEKTIQYTSNVLASASVDEQIELNEQETDSSNARLFCQLLKTLKFYTTFEIDDQTGEAKTEAEVQELHYEKLKTLQKGVFKYFRDDLQIFALTNIATIDKRECLLKHLGDLSADRLYELAEYLHLVPKKLPEDAADSQELNANLTQVYTVELLLEIIISHMERRSSQIDELNSLPLYPTEEIIWDENVVPSGFSHYDTCLSLPKLNLQFLTLHDYLLRNFHLFHLEAAYELRQDIEDACIRLHPYYSYEEQAVAFNTWSRMAQPIVNFNVIEVAKPNVGEQAPSRVRADIMVNLELNKKEIKLEWNNLRKYDVGYLVAIRPFNTQEQRYNPNEPFVTQMGLIAVRGCEIEGILNEDGKLIGDEMNPNQSKPEFSDDRRTYRVILDANQYKMDNDKLINGTAKEDIYSQFNVFIRRRPKESNFKAVLESIRDLMNTNFVVPDWLRDLLLGYGDPAAAHYSNMTQPAPLPTLSFCDTFLSREHLISSFPDYQVEVAEDAAPPYKLTFTDLLPKEQEEQMDTEEKKIIRAQSYKVLSRGPYKFEQPKFNTVKFTPTQVEAVKSGMQPGLTIVVGPPGTGKTDVAVQIISNIYHNFPEQRTLIVTHSNQALNQLFEKIMALDIDERHLLRLGHGEEGLETEKDFSRYGRVNYILSKRLQLLDEVDRLQKSLEGPQSEGAAYSCDTAAHYYFNHIITKWDWYTNKIKEQLAANKAAKTADNQNIIPMVEELFPFKAFFSNAPQPLFKKVSFDEDYNDVAKGCFRYIKKIFKQLEEFKAFELIRNGADRAEYLLVKEAKIIAMTCTHAALKRKDLVKCNFRYDNILMEEAAQILEIETFIPLLLQNPDHNGNNRLKRWIMIGDHHQLPPVIKNMAIQKYSNMEQSLFTRFVKLGIPTVDLDAQGRARSSLCELYKWRYKSLGNLDHVEQLEEFQLANTGLAFDYQLINVEDFNGKGETEPQKFYYQNLAEAEYVVALFMFMRLIGYPAEKISILTTYNGQKHLIRDVLRQRCAGNALIGQPKRITTVDKYQGQQNDYILLSLVKTKNIGHFRDVRRLIVAMSRARLGLYIFARVSLFKSCYELTPVFNILLKRPTKLQLVLNELYPTQRKVS